MTGLSADMQARQLFAARSIETARETYNMPKMAVKLGKGINALRQRASQLIVPHIVDGEVRMPKAAKRIAEAIPVVALQPGESVTLSDEFVQPSALQSQRVLEVFDGWEPLDVSSQTMLQSLTKESIALPDRPRVEVTKGSVATAYAAAITFMPEAGDFKRAPADGIGWISCKPLILLNWLDDETHAEPDLLAHELVHIAQKIKRPVRLFSCQQDFVKDRLRDELEAYHAGARVRLSMDATFTQNKPGELPSDTIDMQLAVESVRLRVKTALGEEKTDPFGPSKLVMRKIDDLFGLEKMIHHSFDYDALHRLISKPKPSAE